MSEHRSKGERSFSKKLNELKQQVRVYTWAWVAGIALLLAACGPEAPPSTALATSTPPIPSSDYISTVFACKQVPSNIQNIKEYNAVGNEALAEVNKNRKEKNLGTAIFQPAFGMSTWRDDGDGKMDPEKDEKLFNFLPTSVDVVTKSRTGIYVCAQIDSQYR